MSFCGLVPSEGSSGESRRRRDDHQGRIHAHSPAADRGVAEQSPPTDHRLRTRQTPDWPGPARIERAWRCQQRLHRRRQRMGGRGKPHPKIAVGCARAFAGLVWAIATEQPMR